MPHPPSTSDTSPTLYSSPWPSMRGNMRNTGARVPLATVVEEPRKPVGIRHFRTRNSVFSTPVIGPDETLYVGSADGAFYALDPIEGRERWRFQTGEAIDCAACIGEDGTLFVPSCDGSLYALTSDGVEKWRLNLLAKRERFTLSTIYWWEANVVPGPNGLLYAGNDDFYFYAIEPETGSVRWAVPTGLNVWTAAAFDEAGTAFFISFDMYVYAVDTSTGAVKWTANTRNFCASSPVLSPDGILYFGSFDGHLHAVDAAGGASLWRFKTGGPVYATPALAPDGMLYVGSSDGILYAVDPSTRSTRWTFSTGDPIRSSASVGLDPEGRSPYLVYVGGGNGLVYAIDAEGRRRWSYDTLTRAESRDYPNINASIALGHHGLATASANGDVLYIPYDHYLGRDRRGIDLRPGDGYPADGVFLVPLAAGGAPCATPAAGFGARPVSTMRRPSETLSFRVAARRGGQSVPARLIADSVRVDISPSLKHRFSVQPDRVQINVIPEELARPGVDYLVRVLGTLEPTAGMGPTDNLVEGTLRVFMAESRYPPDLSELLEMPFRISRMSIYSPSIVPSFDQIGIASLQIDVQVVSVNSENGTFIAVGVQKFGVNEAGELVGVPSPRFLRFAFSGRYDRGHLLMVARDCSFELTSAAVPVELLRFGTGIDSLGAPTDGGSMLVESNYTVRNLSIPSSLTTPIASGAELGFAGVRGLIPDADVLRRALSYARTWVPETETLKALPEYARALIRVVPFGREMAREGMHRSWDLLDDAGKFSGIGTFRATKLERGASSIVARTEVEGFVFVEAQRRLVAILLVPEASGWNTLVPSIILVDVVTSTPIAMNYDRYTTFTRAPDGRPVDVTLDVPLTVALRTLRVKALVMVDLRVVGEFDLDLSRKGTL